MNTINIKHTTSTTTNTHLTHSPLSNTKVNTKLKAKVSSKGSSIDKSKQKDKLVTQPKVINRGYTLTPTQIKAIKTQIVKICLDNRTNSKNIDDIRAELQPLVDQLDNHFKMNRPSKDEEIKLTTGTWQSLWYDDKDIEASEGFFQRLNKDKVFQIVYFDKTKEENFYYNVSESKLFGLGFLRIKSFLRGDYTLKDTPQRKNVIALKFGQNKFFFGKLKKGKSIKALTDKVISGDKKGINIPGPKGITGELFNLYIDEEIRIAGGYQENDDTFDLFILTRNDSVK